MNIININKHVTNKFSNKNNLNASNNKDHVLNKFKRPENRCKDFSNYKSHVKNKA